MSDIAIVELDAVREGSSIISVASFASITDALPKMATLSLAQFLAQFEQHTVIADKHSGKLWSPTIYADGANRKSTNVVAITALVVDVDDGTPFAELEAKLARSTTLCIRRTAIPQRIRSIGWCCRWLRPSCPRNGHTFGNV